MSRLMITLLGLAVCAMSHAQKISFDKTEQNMGNVEWHSPVTATYTLTNKDRSPISIKTVDGGCGCVDVKWTKGTIERNGKAQISVTYDAEQTGTFDRIIEVTMNGHDSPIRLRMRGKVTGGGYKTMAERFPYKIGDILLSTDNIEFIDSHYGDSAKVRMELINEGHEVFVPQIMHMPNYLSVEATPNMIAAGKKGYLIFTLHSEKLPSMGLTQSSVYLAREAGDKVCKENEIGVSAVLLPEAKTSANPANAPKFAVSKTTLDMGTMGKKKKLSGSMTISNKGRSPLDIKSVQVFTPAVSLSLPKRQLAPGETISVKVELRSDYLKRYKGQPRILFITSDPEHPKEIVTLTYK